MAGEGQHAGVSSEDVHKSCMIGKGLGRPFPMIAPYFITSTWSEMAKAARIFCWVSSMASPSGLADSALTRRCRGGAAKLLPEDHC